MGYLMTWAFSATCISYYADRDDVYVSVLPWRPIALVSQYLSRKEKGVGY